MARLSISDERFRVVGSSCRARLTVCRASPTEPRGYSARRAGVSLGQRGGARNPGRIGSKAVEQGVGRVPSPYPKTCSRRYECTRLAPRFVWLCADHVAVTLVVSLLRTSARAV